MNNLGLIFDCMRGSLAFDIHTNWMNRDMLYRLISVLMDSLDISLHMSMLNMSDMNNGMTFWFDPLMKTTFLTLIKFNCKFLDNLLNFLIA